MNSEIARVISWLYCASSLPSGGVERGALEYAALSTIVGRSLTSAAGRGRVTSLYPGLFLLSQLFS